MQRYYCKCPYTPLSSLVFNGVNIKFMNNFSDVLLKQLLSQPLQIEENEPERDKIEQHIKSLNENQIVTLYTRTRKAAAQSKHSKNLTDLFLYVRACKTIQRVAAEKGIVLTTGVRTNP